ncbi:hypothetical protein WKV44_09985 [Spirochaetia bacterium 38H-sp]|uniref:Uncharacterized protein n=1 Tax=Rarispira pelagica TaxID=3141764 RepID=A0ABU9UEA7_9SPIR
MTYDELTKLTKEKNILERNKIDIKKLTQQEVVEIIGDKRLILLITPSVEKSLAKLANEIPRRLKFTGPRPWLDKLYKENQQQGEEGNDKGSDKSAI